MTQSCSDMSPRMRLFELLRQQNMAKRRTHKHVHGNPHADVDRFLAEAIRSLFNDARPSRP